MTIRAFLVTDFGTIELPNHETALRNLDFTNIRLLIRREYGKAVK